MEEKLDVHITDTVENLDLKIYEEETNEGTIFSLHINRLGEEKVTVLKMKETIAALIFEGLNQIFIEDDTEYQRDEDTVCKKQSTKDVLEDFFNILYQCDKEHFDIRELK
jgi:uncharacterized protein YdcH (DUF465 family)